MAYINDIPMATDQLSVSQPQIQGNFLAIDALINVNHVGFNLSDAGKHNFITFPVQTSDPRAGKLPTEVLLFNLRMGITTVNELWLATSNNTAGHSFEYPISASILSTVEVPADGSTGWAYLPSGILLKWGTFSGLVAGVNNNLQIGVIPGNSTFGPPLQAVMNVQLTTTANGGTVGYVSSNVSITPQVMSINCTAPANNVRYFIIGA